jgi:hypothetical protein
MRTYVVRKLAFMAAVAVLAGCEGASTTEPDPAGLLDITPDQPAYTAGSLVTFTLHNSTATPVIYSNCGIYRIEMRLGGMWVPAPRNAIDFFCPGSVGTVLPGETAVEHVELLPDQADGTYRVVFLGVSADNHAPGEVPSHTFKVTDG